MADVRIIDQQEITSLETDSYVLTDNSTDGTKKYNLKRLDTAISEVASDLTDETSAREAAVTELKSDGVVPSADQLISDNYTIDQTPYLYRQTNSNGADRAIEEIVGGSVVWNQLVNISNLRTRTIGGLTFTNNNDGSVSVAGTATATNAYSMNTYAVSVIAGRKYYVHGVATTNNYGISITSALSSPVGTDGIVISSNQTSANINLYVNEGATLNIKVYPQIHDLTAMFGTTIADYIYNLEQSSTGAGVAFFRALFPEDYYAYNAGNMMHVSGVSAKKNVVKNLLLSVCNDVVLAYRTADASAVANVDNVSPTKPILVKAGNAITISTTSTFYNLGYTILNLNGDSIARTNVANTTSATIPAYSFDVYLYVWFNRGLSFSSVEVAKEWMQSAKVQIEIGNERTEYIGEPYTYPLDSSLTLRGIPKLDSDNQLYFDGDTYAADGTVTRKYGIVDLGTLSWTYQSERFRSSSLDSVIKRPDSVTAIPSIVCSTYVSYSNDTNFGNLEKGITVLTQTNNSILVRNSSYTDAATLKSAMSGVYLVYELATPTTETADPYTNPQICDPYGTEEFVSISIVPVGHYTKYPENLRAKLENLDLSMIAPIETGTTASQAYAVGKYFLLNNKFCKAKTAIASGATFTLNTNYEVTTIADELYTALNA